MNPANPDETPAPFTSEPMQVLDEWTDYNGHLNMAWYHVLFDRAIEPALEPLGMGAQVAAETGSSYFTVQAQIHYLRELHAGDVVVVDTQLIAHDDKRLHYVQTMRRPADGVVAAITENLVVHVDLATRRAAPFAPALRERLAAAVAAHAGLALPKQVGRRVGLPRAAADPAAQ